MENWEAGSIGSDTVDHSFTLQSSCKLQPINMIFYFNETVPFIDYKICMSLIITVYRIDT